MDSSGQFFDDSCVTLRHFICYDGKDQSYVFINMAKTWRDAQRYCRQYHTELVSVRNKNENLQIQKLIPAGDKVFIGLFRDAYMWSDNSKSSFRNWHPNQPDGSGDCVMQLLKEHNLWDDDQCSNPKPFFCYSIMKKRQIIKMVVKSDQNVNDPGMNMAILEKVKQKLEEMGMPNDTNLEWKQSSEGIFRPLMR
ncbi:macrophage mannose receptor 1-like isoform X2 [Xyrauchen texanus]|nr:macrophage mannose receptor 1-like isoform X2 [Xyrauchen texanus]